MTRSLGCNYQGYDFGAHYPDSICIGGRFMAAIQAHGQFYYLGSGKDPTLLGHEYNKAAIALHGEFARLNPVGTCPRTGE